MCSLSSFFKFYLQIKCNFIMNSLISSYSSTMFHGRNRMKIEQIFESDCDKDFLNLSKHIKC